MPDILIVKFLMPLPHKQFRVILDHLKAQKETGVVLLPPYLEAQIVPDNIEIKLVDENGNEEKADV